MSVGDSPLIYPKLGCSNTLGVRTYNCAAAGWHLTSTLPEATKMPVSAQQQPPILDRNPITGEYLARVKRVKIAPATLNVPQQVKRSSTLCPTWEVTRPAGLGGMTLRFARPVLSQSRKIQRGNGIAPRSLYSRSTRPGTGMPRLIDLSKRC